LPLSLKLTQTSLRPVEGCGGAVSLGRDASELFALVSLSLTALLGFVFPLIATMFHFGELTHDARALISCHVHRPWGPGGLGLR
jgi:hypothetical protein